MLNVLTGPILYSLTPKMHDVNSCSSLVEVPMGLIWHLLLKQMCAHPNARYCGCKMILKLKTSLKKIKEKASDAIFRNIFQIILKL